VDSGLRLVIRHPTQWTTLLLLAVVEQALMAAAVQVAISQMQAALA
jgi:hypothetical protein